MNEERGFPRHHDGIDAWMTQNETAKLKELAHGIYCEIGTYQGHSLLAVLDRVEWLITIDPKEQPLPKKLSQQQGSKVHYYINRAENVFPLLSANIDTLFIDGNHKRVALDFAYFFPLVKLGGTVIFHDYYRLYPKVMAFVDSLPYPIEHLESLAWFTKTYI